eukprot:303344_1
MLRLTPQNSCAMKLLKASTCISYDPRWNAGVNIPVIALRPSAPRNALTATSGEIKGTIAPPRGIDDTTTLDDGDDDDDDDDIAVLLAIALALLLLVITVFIGLGAAEHTCTSTSMRSRRGGKDRLRMLVDVY